MAYSMTAYATVETPITSGLARWELRSLNHRHLDLSLKLPENFQVMEPVLRELVRRQLTRGKIDCVLRIDRIEAKRDEWVVDPQVLEQLTVASSRIKESFPDAQPLSVHEILRWPSVLGQAQDITQESGQIEKGFQQALDELVAARQKEGEKILECLQTRLTKVDTLVKEIAQRLPQIETHFREKLLKRVEEVSQSVDTDRFHQEVLYALQKMNISEEIDRLKIHLSETKRLLSTEKTLGRRLDFLFQEFNREINTMASKTIDNTVAQHCIELKVLVDEMREQAHNVE